MEYYHILFSFQPQLLVFPPALRISGVPCKWRSISQSRGNPSLNGITRERSSR